MISLTIYSWLVLRSQSLDSSYGQPTKKEAVKEISPSKDWSSIDWYDTDWERYEVFS